MQPLLGRLDPGLEPIALPDLRLDQHDTSRLHEQNAQVTTAPPGYLAEDGAVSGRHLLSDQAQPGSEVATFGEGISSTDRCHHRAGDDRPDAGYTHQPLATGVMPRNSLDLARQAFDALIKPAPVARQILDHPHHTR